MVCDIFDTHVHVYTPIGDTVVVDQVYHVFPMLFIGYQTWLDFAISYITHFGDEW